MSLTIRKLLMAGMGFAAFSGYGIRAASSRDVMVFTYITSDGKKLTAPTGEHPGSYLLLSGGYKEMGALTAGEKGPDPARVEKLVRKALDQNHYEGITKKSTKCDFLIVCHWGYMNPQVDEIGGSEVFFNRKQMLGLVGGQALDHADLNFEREDIMQAAKDDRYFVIVSVFDFAAAQKSQKKLLWRTQMSLPSVGINQDEALPALVAAGTPLFGKETFLPKQVWKELDHRGEVEVGTPTVEEYVPAIQMPPSATPPASAAKKKP